MQALLRRAVLISIGLGIPAGGKPLPGEPPVGPEPAQGNQGRPAVRVEDAGERALREAVGARDQADLARAAFEADHRAGPLGKEAVEAFAAVVAGYERVIGRPNASPEVLKVIVYAHVRLAGAYQYVQQFDKAVAQAKKGVEVSAGTPSEVEATFTVGLIYLQAMHDPAKALPFFQRTQELAPNALQEANEQAKWLTAAGEAIERCRREK